MAGPFKILERIGHSYRVELPDSIKVHNVFPADRLRKAADDPLPGQINEPPPPIEITGDQEYEVQELIAVKLDRGKLLYRASWVGYDEDLTFYPASDFKYAPHKLRDFHIANPSLPGPPRALDQWIKAWESGKEDYDSLDDDRPLAKGTKGRAKKKKS